jgi:hypothetical protein
LARINTSRLSIPAGSFARAPVSQGPILKKGIYKASVNADYDGFPVEFETNFSLGEPIIRVFGLVSNNLIAGEINKVFFRARNEWNTELRTKAIMSINKVKNEMPEFVIEPEKEQLYSGFIDTTTLEPGSYNLTITLVYDSQIRNYVFPVSIKSRQEVLVSKSSRTIIFLLVLSVLVVLAAILIISIIRKKKALQ